MLAVAGTVSMATQAQANEASSRLIEDGIAILESGDPGGATQTFIDAYEADPSDGRAAFLVGLGMNRLGDWVQALTALTEAARLGYDDPEIEVQTAIALIGLGQSAAAIPRLEAYEAAMPGNGTTSALLGRAWLDRGDTMRARAYFEEAIARDPALRSTVEFQLAAIEVSEGDPEAAAVYLDSIVQNDPTSPLGQYLGERLRQLSATGAPPEQKIWSMIASFAVGHDDNAIALGDTIPLPANITNQSGPFVESAIAGSLIAFSRPGVDQLTISASASGRRYGNNLSTVDSESLSAGLDYQALIQRGLAGRVQAFLGNNMSHGDLTNRYAGLRGFVQFESFDVLWEPWIGVTYTEYNLQGFVAPADERSGPTQAGGVSGRWWWEAVEAEMRAGLAYSTTQTKGTNFDNHGWSTFIGIRKELSNEVTADLGYSFIDSNFDNQDTRATPPGSANRSDQTHLFSLQLSKPVWNNVTLFGRFNATVNNSNIAAFTYDRIETLAGVAASF